MKKIVLAYSGGLDTSIILRWLQENYKAEIIAYTSDIGQVLDKKKIVKNAKRLGVKKIIIEEIKEISGNAQIIDGDTIKINSKKIRLHGIDAPEFKQMCKKPYLTIIFFTFTKDYPCGKISTQKLQKKINNKVITCKILDVDRYKRFIGECYKRNLNLNSWLVSNGYAVAYRKYSKKYISNEIKAKNEKKGLWQGKFEMPWDFRRKK